MNSLPKQNIPLPLAIGLETKVDPWQLDLGKFLALNNCVYTQDKMLMKRNGFGELPSIGSDINTLTTFSGALTAIGTHLYNYAPETLTWYNKGPIYSLDLETTPIVRSASSQTQQDSAITEAGLVCTVWSDSDGNCKYQVNDGASSQIIVSATNLPTGAILPKVFILRNYFIITFISSSTHLKYIALPLLNPSSPTAAADLATNAIAGGAYDGFVYNNNLYFAWNATGPEIQVSGLDYTLSQRSVKTIASRTGTYISVTADSGNGNIWVNFFDGANSKIYSAVYDSSLNVVLAATIVVASVASTNRITSVSSSGVSTLFYETSSTYEYTIAGGSGNAGSDYVTTVTMTAAGTPGTPAVMLRGVALASKAFIANSGAYYVLVVYGSGDVNNNNYQPTYFLSDSSGNILSRFANSNAGGYPSTSILPGVWVYDDTAAIGYLYKDLLTSVNKVTTAGIPTAGIYSQTGINLATFTFNPQQIADSEIGASLHVTGGMLWQYDGAKPVEHGFSIWPEDLGTSYNASSAVTPTGTFSTTSTSVVVSSATGISVGMSITDTSNATYIPANTLITAISGTTLTISKATTHAGSGDNLSIQGNIVAQPDGVTNANAYAYQATYEWTDAQGNIHRSAPSVPVFVTTSSTGSAGSITLKVPTLRLTYKTGANKVRIVIYRWSVANQVYYQVTSVTSPLLNDTTVDSVTFVDNLPDASVLGNQIIYTNGGVLENIAAPACIDTALFKSRLFLIDAEDRNLLWYSKVVLEATPVETSDLLTQYVAPTTGAQGPTGPNRAIAAMDDKLIIFKDNAIYYMSGEGPDNTGANNDFTTPVFITSTVGCTNVQSIVFIPQGLMFQSDKGIWLLGRDMSTNYIGAAVEGILGSATVESAINVPKTTQVRFTLDNGLTLMYDYYYNRWGVFTGIPGVSSAIFQGYHTYANDSGAVFQETPGLYLDGSHPVLISFTTGWCNLNGLQGYQRAYWLHLLANYLTPHTLQIQVAYDYNPAIYDQKLIAPTNFNPTYGYDAGNYGDVGPYGGNPSVEDWRVFFSKQRCQSFQITVQELFDPSFDTAAGAGLTFSGIGLVVAAKKAYRPSSAASSTG